MEETMWGRKETHVGQNIARIRELKGIKQETLAGKLGVSQQVISKLEHRGNMKDKRLEEIADALGVTAEFIKKFDEKAAIDVYNNTFNDNANNYNVVGNNTCSPSFDPLDKIMELTEKNEELYKELLKSEREKIDLLEKINKSVLSMVEEIKKLIARR